MTYRSFHLRPFSNRTYTLSWVTGPEIVVPPFRRPESPLPTGERENRCGADGLYVRAAGADSRASGIKKREIWWVK